MALTADDLRALSAAATPDPWDINPDQSHYLAPQVRFGGGMGGLSASGLHNEGDAELIVWLRNHADKMSALWEAAGLALQDVNYECYHARLYGGDPCRELWPDDETEWCGICCLIDALAALDGGT